MSEPRISLTPPTVPTSANPQPGEVGYVPPTDIVPLPSRGMCYPVDHPFHGVETVAIKSMTAREEDILTSRALLKQGRAMSALLKSCLIDRAVDPEELLSGDRNALLTAIRITGYGKEYEVEISCPTCEEDSKQVFNLATLKIKRLEVDPLAPGSNAFSYSMPVSGKTAIFRLPTGASEREVEQTQEGAKKKLGPAAEANVTTRLFYHIVSIGEETDRQKLSQIIRNLPARDSRGLRNYMDKIACGVEMVQQFTCVHCGQTTEVDVPMGTEFFWPKAG